MRKVNCKNNLFPRQELEARKIRRILIGEVEDTDNKVRKRIENLYKDFKFGYIDKIRQKDISLFYGFVMRWDIEVYSAFERVGGVSVFSEYVVKANYFKKGRK